jgi:hypothetical protein
MVFLNETASFLFGDVLPAHDVRVHTGQGERIGFLASRHVAVGIAGPESSEAALSTIRELVYIVVVRPAHGW